MQERPQLLHAVLNGGAGKQQAIATVEVQQCPPSGTSRALDCVGFIQDHVLPFQPLEIFLVGNNYLIAGDENMKWGVLLAKPTRVPKLAEDLSILDGAPVRENFECRCKSDNLLMPVVQRGSRSNNQKRTPDILSLH